MYMFSGAGWQTNLQNSRMPPTASYKAPILLSTNKTGAMGAAEQIGVYRRQNCPFIFSVLVHGSAPYLSLQSRGRRGIGREA